MMHKFPNVYYNTAIESVHVSSECHWHSLIVQLFNIKTILHKFSFELILHPQPQLLSFLIKILLITLSLPFFPKSERLFFWMGERGPEDSMQTTRPENKGRVGPQGSTKLLSRIKATG